MKKQITITLDAKDAELVRSVLWFEWMNTDLEDETDSALGRALFLLDEQLIEEE